MRYHNFLIVWRNIRNNKTHSLVNILGLVVGMIAAILIFEYVIFEWSYDRFHTDYQDIYRVVNDRYQHGQRIQHGMITYPMVGPAMQQDYPEVALYTRMLPRERTGIIYKNQPFTESEVFYADEHFFSVFDFPLLAGDRQMALSAPNAVAISESLARKIFGDNEGRWDQVLGETLGIFNRQNPCKLAAVFKDVPENSHLRFQLLISYSSFIASGNEWADQSRQISDIYHYVKLSPNTDPTHLNQKLEEFGVKYFGEGEISGSVEKFYLQPLKEAHLFSDFDYEVGLVNNGKALFILLGIGFFIVLIAWINYINLTTAKALERAKEVGIRKVIGANRHQLIRQFFMETVILNLIAIFVALAMLQLLQPRIQPMAGKSTFSFPHMVFGRT